MTTTKPKLDEDVPLFDIEVGMFLVIPSGSELPRAPEWSAVVTADYSLPLPGNLELNFMVNHTRLAKQKRALGESGYAIPGRIKRTSALPSGVQTTNGPIGRQRFS